MKIILHEANGLQIGQRHQDGYINLTQMAQASGKLIADYLRLDTTQAFINELSTDMGIPISGKNGLIQIRKGGNNKAAQGTWGHPQVAINCGQWCSPRFAVLVSKWVVNWMTTGKRPISHTEDYLDSLLPTAKAYIQSSQALNRAIHTAIHQQTGSLKQALESLFTQETLTTGNSTDTSTNFSACQSFDIKANTPHINPPAGKSNLLSQQQAPTKEPTVRVTVDLAESMHRKLSLLAAQTGRKKAEIVRFLLDEALQEVEE
ncbi:MAG: KilA-N domain-containing protein [Calothrix sp. MO_167.B12]|nr:KilA-N domain-containing protein [Calothrix sp. MO_167.B12]